LDLKEEPTKMREAIRVAKGGKLFKNKKSLKSFKFPPIKVLDDARTNILALNALGHLCNIQPLYDNQVSRLDLTIKYKREIKVKIKKRARCRAFLTMLHSCFDVGIWALIREALL